MDEIAVLNVKKFEKKSCIVETSHILFGKQKYIIEELHIIEPELGVGIMLHGQNIYIPRYDLIHIEVFENGLMAYSNKMKIIIHSIL